MDHKHFYPIWMRQKCCYQRFYCLTRVGQHLYGYSSHASIFGFLGRTSINQIFQLTQESQLESYEEVRDYLEPYIRNAFEQLAAADYPYNTSFYDVLPGWSVEVGGKAMA